MSSESEFGGRERRDNLTLRELLDELIELVRHLARNSGNLDREELERAQERLEWLADEIWRAALAGGNPDL